MQEGGVLIAEGTAATLFPDTGLFQALRLNSPRVFMLPDLCSKCCLAIRPARSSTAIPRTRSALCTKAGRTSHWAGGRGGGGGGRGGNLPAGVGGGNLQPMAAPPRLTTLDAGPPAAAAAGAGRGGRGGGGFGGGGGRGGFGGGGAAANAPRVLLTYPTDPNDLLLSGELVGGELSSVNLHSSMHSSARVTS